jgi:hypothetical protein
MIDMTASDNSLHDRHRDSRPPWRLLKCSLRCTFSPAVLRTVTSLWLVLLIVGSLQPARPRIVTGVHRQLHWVAFAGAVLLLLSLSRARSQDVLRAFAVFSLGVSLELLQHLIYRNPIEWHDIKDNGVAVFVAFALYRLFRHSLPA